MSKTMLAALVAFALSLASIHVRAESAGPVLLTVAGAVSNPNRGPVDPDYDKFFAFQEDSFERAHGFDLSALAALDAVAVSADFPKAGPVRRFEGPLLADVLKVSGAEGETVTLRALDGYAVEAPLAELLELGAVLALRRDGRALGVGDFGPAQLVFPRAERADLADMPDDWWVWSIYLIQVE